MLYEPQFYNAAVNIRRNNEIDFNNKYNRIKVL